MFPRPTFSTVARRSLLHNRCRKSAHNSSVTNATAKKKYCIETNLLNVDSIERIDKDCVRRCVLKCLFDKWKKRRGSMYEISDKYKLQCKHVHHLNKPYSLAKGTEIASICRCAVHPVPCIWLLRKIEFVKMMFAIHNANDKHNPNSIILFLC